MSFGRRALVAARKRRGGGWWNALLLARGLANLGLRFQCPCCGWRLARFVHAGALFRRRPAGYCPRCNAKARHRRDWLFLERLEIPPAAPRLLDIAPAWSLARRLRAWAGPGYIAGDLEDRGVASVRMDACRLPLRDSSVGAVVCIHVLEHVSDDRAAIREMFRVLDPSGWALITVPLSTAPETLEDPSVTSPEERRRLFGETTHLRLHGADFPERLREAGFEVTTHPASEAPEGDRRRFGLLLDETVHLCRKPAG